MEEHLRNRDRLDADWEEIKAYESEEAVPCEAAQRPENARKNRDGCPIPCKLTIFLIWLILAKFRSIAFLNIVVLIGLGWWFILFVLKTLVREGWLMSKIYLYQSMPQAFCEYDPL